MSLTNYEIGRNFEYRVIKYLRENGFFVVRSAKSSFPDILAVRKSTGKTICVECKVNGYLNHEEKLGLIRIWVNYDIHPFVARREGRKMKIFDFLFNEDINTI
jgi:Holliday junction resolvase